MDEQKFQSTLIKRQKISWIIPAPSLKLRVHPPLKQDKTPHLHWAARNAEVSFSIRHHPYFMYIYLSDWLRLFQCGKIKVNIPFLLMCKAMTKIANIYLHWPMPVSSSLIHSTVELKFHSIELRLAHCLFVLMQKKNEKSHGIHLYILSPKLKSNSISYTDIFWFSWFDRKVYSEMPSIKSHHFRRTQQFTLNEIALFDFGKTHIMWMCWKRLLWNHKTIYINSKTQLPSFENKASHTHRTTN